MTSVNSLSLYHQAKHLQFVSGVNAIAYWLANYAWDLLNAVVIVIIVFIFIVAFQTDGYTGQGLGAVLVLMVRNGHKSDSK